MIRQSFFVRHTRECWRRRRLLLAAAMTFPADPQLVFNEALLEVIGWQEWLIVTTIGDLLNSLFTGGDQGETFADVVSAGVVGPVQFAVLGTTIDSLVDAYRITAVRSCMSSSSDRVGLTPSLASTP